MKRQIPICLFNEINFEEIKLNLFLSQDIIQQMSGTSLNLTTIKKHFDILLS